MFQVHGSAIVSPTSSRSPQDTFSARSPAMMMSRPRELFSVEEDERQPSIVEVTAKGTTFCGSPTPTPVQGISGSFRQDLWKEEILDKISSGFRQDLSKSSFKENQEGNIPEELLNEIRAGNCVAFIGAGFCRAANFPDWYDLLDNIREDGQRSGVLQQDESDRLKEVIDDNRPSKNGRNGQQDSSALDRCAQILEDKMGRATFAESVAKSLRADGPLPEQMNERLRLLRGIPFRGILTTNFDLLVKGPPAMHPDARAKMQKILRAAPLGLQDQVLQTIGDPEGGEVPVIQVHGSIDDKYCSEPGLVFTRLGYRNLLHGDATYSKFIAAVMATKTVLYLGFSFTDGYINELRSATVMMLGEEKLHAYAVVANKEPMDIAFFREHEGVHLVNYRAPPWERFDDILRIIHDRTNPVLRFANSMHNKPILWCGAPLKGLGLDKLRAAMATLNKSMDIDSWDEAGNAVQWVVNKLATKRYHLVVTAYGEKEKRAISLLRAMRQDLQNDQNCPVIVYSNAENCKQRKAECLRFGARQYVTRMKTLLEELFAVLADAEETM